MKDEQDPGSEEFVWPEVKDLRPTDAGRLLDAIEREAAAANKRADLLKSRKAQAKALLGAVLEEYEQNGVRFTSATGKEVQYTPYDFDAFTVDNPEEFKPWAEMQSESYYDSTPKLRDAIFQAEMRRRLKDKEPLPPGVRRWTDVRYSRSATKAT